MAKDPFSVLVLVTRTKSLKITGCRCVAHFALSLFSAITPFHVFGRSRNETNHFFHFFFPPFQLLSSDNNKKTKNILESKTHQTNETH